MTVANKPICPNATESSCADCNCGSFKNCWGYNNPNGTIMPAAEISPTRTRNPRWVAVAGSRNGGPRHYEPAYEMTAVITSIEYQHHPTFETRVTFTEGSGTIRMSGAATFTVFYNNPPSDLREKFDGLKDLIGVSSYVHINQFFDMKVGDLVKVLYCGNNKMSNIELNSTFIAVIINGKMEFPRHNHHIANAEHLSVTKEQRKQISALWKQTRSKNNEVRAAANREIGRILGDQ